MVFSDRNDLNAATASLSHSYHESKLWEPSRALITHALLLIIALWAVLLIIALKTKCAQVLHIQMWRTLLQISLAKPTIALGRLIVVVLVWPLSGTAMTLPALHQSEKVSKVSHRKLRPNLTGAEKCIDFPDKDLIGDQQLRQTHFQFEDGDSMKPVDDPVWNWEDVSSDEWEEGDLEAEERCPLPLGRPMDGVDVGHPPRQLRLPCSAMGALSVPLHGRSILSMPGRDLSNKSVKSRPRFFAYFLALDGILKGSSSESPQTSADSTPEFFSRFRAATM